VELGISAGAGIETDLRTRRADGPQRQDAAKRAVTEHILTVADQAGYGAALIGAMTEGSGEASVITWPQFAHMVRAAARGLSRRGLQEADTAGILVQDAVSHVVAVHAVRAAGAIAVPIRPSQTAADIAAQLKQGRARLLITSAALAELAIQAAERSWVRQVFAFGEAEGTTPFGSLLHTARHGQLQANGSAGHNDSNGGNGHDGGHVAPQVLDLAGLGADGLGADGLGADGLRAALGLTHRDVVVAAPPCGDPDAYTSLLDLALAAGATIVAAPLPQVTAVIGVYKGTAAIVPRETDVPGLPRARVFIVG
jgi:acyl-CoA synthetase (AMP-forming)/AMP-acid ligase II